jgi:hypothetical protein
VGQVLGGAAVLIGAGAAYLQFTQQQQASRDLLISNQVSKGFEQLAGQETAMRLGPDGGLSPGRACRSPFEKSQIVPVRGVTLCEAHMTARRRRTHPRETASQANAG